jgi:hypothetical protein
MSATALTLFCVRQPGADGGLLVQWKAVRAFEVIRVVPTSGRNWLSRQGTNADV